MKQQTTNNQDVKAIFSKFDNTSNWVSGLCGNYYFEAKLFDEPSDFGINDGRVSKLTIQTKANTIIVNYDRGWDIEPVLTEKPIYEAIVELLENSPKRFDPTTLDPMQEEKEGFTGVWKFVPTIKSECTQFFKNEDEESIFTVWHNENSHKEKVHINNLISNAPAMYEALKTIESVLSNWDKATGAGKYRNLTEYANTILNSINQ